MRGFVVGLLVGLSVSVVSGGTTPGWFTGASLMNGETNTAKGIRVGYAAGATDMLNAIVDAGTELSPYLQKQHDCLENRSGGNLGQFVQFAETLWRGRDQQAATILLGRACN